MIQSQSMTQEIGTLIDQLAAKLSVPAAKLWAVLVQQARAEAIATVVIIALLAVALFVVWGVLRPKINAWKSADKSYMSDREVGWMIFTIGAVGFSIFAFVFTVSGIYDVILYTLNPDYYALEKILTALK